MLSPQIHIVRASADSSAANSKRSTGSFNSQGLPANRYSGSNISRSSRGSITSSSRGSFNDKRRTRDDSISIQWPDKPMDRAPELNLLAKRQSSFSSGFTADCIAKILRLVTAFFKSFNQVGDAGLSNLKPISARTEHDYAYLLEIAREYTINLKYGGAGTSASSVVVRTPSGTSIRSYTGSKASKSSKRSSTTSSKKQKQREQQQVKSQLLKDLYEKAYRTLSILQQCIGHFKTVIFDMTYTKYSEDDLTEPEVKMTRGKSIIGSFIWLITYTLQQMTDDPDVEQFENTPKANSDMTELAAELQSLVSLSLQTWHELLLAIGIIERVNKRTEETFAKQTTIFETKSKPDSDTANLANSQMKYRRSQGHLHELRNFKGIDPYANLLTWSNRRQVASRVLYITKYTDPDSLWLGFDPLPVDKKIPCLKDLLNFTKLVFESVRENIHKINTDLQGLSRQDTLTPGFRKQPPPSNTNRQQPNHFTGIMAYEDGIDAMDEILAKKFTNIEWNVEEIHEFFETDKIFLDDMDLLTLGACVTRTILYEATHIVHICYETCRLLDYKEFIILPSYEKLYYRVREDYVDSKSKGRRLSNFSPGPHLYDTEEPNLDLRNVAGLFRTSNYQEILKNIPVYTNRIGLTLQDPEMVFTPSSEKLLS